MLLEPRIGQEFDGIVTGASDKGTWLRLFQPQVEGKIVQGSAGLDLGDRARVKLLSTHVERGSIDFARVDGTKRLRGRSQSLVGIPPESDRS